MAENVSIVTAEEIKAMHAHTLAEVLNRQSGVFVDFFGQDFLGDAALRLLGTGRHHVLLLLDGVRLNQNSSGAALSHFIPLGIIKRVEIIKGAASSSWGSALGGVINIITKDVGKSNRPTGNINVSYGGGDSRDVSADVAGKAKALGYYLYGGNIDSDGLRLDRYSERDSVYGKMQLQLPRSSRLTATAGYSDPFNKSLNWEDAWGVTNLNIYEDIEHQNIWGTLYFDTEITKDLTFHLSGQHFDNTFAMDRHSLGNGEGGQHGDLIFGEKWEDESNSFTGRLTWASESVAANLGLESSRSEMQYVSGSGAFFGGPLLTKDDSVTENRHGVYANVTYIKDNFSITPGLRYDEHSNSEESVNPSLGLTYLFSPDTLFRSSIAKGFSAPYLAASSHSPNLEPENIWTYQAGIETGRIPSLYFKGAIFYHDIKDAWDYNVVPWANTGTIRLNGFEVEVKTAVYRGLSLIGNFTYVKEKSKETSTSTWVDDETYTGNLILTYLNMQYGVKTKFAGHYYWMSDKAVNQEPANGTFLWDVLVAKDFDFSNLNGEVYLKGHNIFNRDQYFDVDYPNPERWLEAGLALKF
ncbi:MAG: TonB-dependent receptor [Candidatus Electrothrix sp. Rat3]|nr:TonB-dependent receptor [Candidatus Electrothrix rattekaaiensis]